MSFLAKIILPASGLMKPVSTFNNVVFPAPFGPIIQLILLGSILYDTFLNASKAPNRLVILIHSNERFSCLSKDDPLNIKYFVRQALLKFFFELGRVQLLLSALLLFYLCFVGGM